MLVLDGGAFRVGGYLLHAAAVFTEGFVFLFGHGAASLVQVLGEQTVYHHIRIAADGRGEMGIVIESQTIVPHVMHGVACLLHGADGDGFNQVLLLLALDVVQQVVDGLGDVGLCTAGTQLVAETGDELCQVVQLLRVGEVVNTVWQHFGFLAFGHAAYLFGYGAVGKQHELLYQLVGIFRLLEVDADGFALLVNFELHFVAVEVDGSCLKAVLTQYFGKLIQLEHLFLEVSFAGFYNLLGFFVGEAAVALDDGMYHA